MLNYKIQLFILILFISNFNLLQSQYTKKIDCELIYKFNDAQPEFNLKDCASLVDKNKDTIEELYIFHTKEQIETFYQEQERQSNFKIKYMSKIAEVIPQCQNLQKLEIVLNIPYFKLQVADLQQLSYNFQNLEKLQYLKLDFANQNLDLQKDKLNLLETYFDSKKLGNLKELHLNFYSNSIMSNFEKVFQNLTGLQYLKCNFGGSQNDIDIIDSENLNSKSFSNQKQLKTLIFEIPKIYDMDFSNIKNAIDQISSLENLYLDISENVVDSFFQPLNLPKLQKVQYNFEGSSFEKNQYEINNLIRNFNNLLEFSIKLSEFQIVDTFKKLGECLLQNKNLKNFIKLDIQNLMFKDESNIAFDHIYEPIQKMEKLQILGLNYKQSYPNCLNYQNFNLMMENKQNLKILSINPYQNCKGTDDYLVDGFKVLINLENLEFQLVTRESLIQIFQNNKKLKNVILKVQNPIIVEQQNLDQLFSQQKLEKLDLQWLFEKSKNEKIELQKTDEYYKGMEKLFQNQQNLLDLRINYQVDFNLEDDEYDDFNFKFINYMLKDLKNLEVIYWEFSQNLNEFNKIIANINLSENFQEMKNLKEISIILQNLDILHINYMKTALQNCQKLEKVYFSLNRIKDVSLSPLVKCFENLQQLKSLELDFSNLNPGGSIQNYEFLAEAFEKNVNLESMVLNINQGNFNEYMQYAFLNNTKLKKLWITYYLNSIDESYGYDSMLYPLYDTVDSFLYLNTQKESFLISHIADLVYLKSQNMRLFIDGNNVQLKKCSDFDSLCSDCSQKIGECSECLFNFKGKSCNSCKDNYFEDIKMKQCFSCNIFEGKDGFEIEDEDACLQEPGVDGLIIGLSIGGGILLIIIVIALLFYIKKKKLERSQNKENSNLLGKSTQFN